ncbi:hypothetical protein DJ568_13615 [Mucilaginibacter hurinus]|uniref:Uncharacterized protein n=1 Tax=Mucilaginibacter hurinus TaxID=2201324 RepID=A0A367GLI1_9SPHI|nr:hypothetical protein [Mucilaginibacter hurinus]RCH54324.1 hypothetical protein DJ568_13615 [Mucilaginibacter hurinus]
MNKVIIFLAVVLFASCSKDPVRTRKCADVICTENFASVTIKFADKHGEGIAVNKYSAVNQRTGDTIRTASAAISNTIAGVYFVVDDGWTKKLSEAGDDIKISGTNPGTGQTKTAVVKVKGGKCACHVEKISGPDQIQFD